MPKIEKSKKISLPTKLKTKKTKTSPIDYYNCLLLKAQENWVDSTTGKKKKITSCCKECKTQTPIFSKQREQEIKKLIVSYQQVGDSLKKLLKPIK